MPGANGPESTAEYELGGIANSSASKIRQHCHPAATGVGELGVDADENAENALVGTDGASAANGLFARSAGAFLAASDAAQECSRSSDGADVSRIETSIRNFLHDRHSQRESQHSSKWHSLTTEFTKLMEPSVDDRT